MQKTLSVINLTAIRSNAQIVRKIIGQRFFFAVVKADAYGHGAAEVAAEIEDVVDGFCVAIAEEGAALRIAGIKKPILVLAPPLDGWDTARLKYYNLIATVADENSAKLAKNLPCHIKLNTGMNRYGCTPKNLKRVLNILNPTQIQGVYSHLYAAENKAEREGQLKLFTQLSRDIKSVNPNVLFHLAASGGILAGERYLFDGVRCGLLLYGYAPHGFKLKGLKPALKVYARQSQKTAVLGGGIGYNLSDKPYKKLYTYRLGYADGFSRGVPLGEKTLCMDAFISTKNKALLPVFTDASAYAKRGNTIPYEVLCSVTKRSEKIYVK